MYSCFCDTLLYFPENLFIVLGTKLMISPLMLYPWERRAMAEQNEASCQLIHGHKSNESPLDVPPTKTIRWPYSALQWGRGWSSGWCNNGGRTTATTCWEDWYVAAACVASTHRESMGPANDTTSHSACMLGCLHALSHIFVSHIGATCQIFVSLALGHAESWILFTDAPCYWKTIKSKIVSQVAVYTLIRYWLFAWKVQYLETQAERKSKGLTNVIL